MYDKRRKKIFSIIIAILFIVSNTAVFIPSIEVKAADIYYNLSDFINYFPTRDEIFTESLYQEGLQSNPDNLDDYTLKNVSDGSFFISDTAYLGLLDRFYSWVNGEGSFGSPNTTYENQSIYVSFSSNVYDTSRKNFVDSLVGGDKESKNVSVVLIVDSAGIDLLIYDNADFNKEFAFIGNYNSFNYMSLSIENAHRYANWFRIRIYNGGCMGSFSDFVNPIWIQYSTGSSRSVLAYSDYPIYFSFYDKGYSASNSEDYSMFTSTRIMYDDYISKGQFSPFFYDRRKLFSNFSDGYTVDTDPISQEYFGAWDIDLVAVDDLLDGQIKVKFTPSQALTEVESGFSIAYTFQLFFNGKNVNNSFLHGSNVYESLCKAYNIPYDKYPVVSTPIVQYYLNPYFSSHSGAFYDNTIDKYASFSASNVLHTIENLNSSYTDITGKHNIDAYGYLKTFVNMGYLNTNSASGSGSISFGGLTVGISASDGGVTSCKLSVYAQAFYKGKEFTDIAVATYDYFTGDVIKSGTTSTYNNNYDGSNPPTGMTQKEYDDNTNSMIQNIIDDGGVKNVTGGTITGGNTNSNATGGTGGNVTNNNNDEINIKSDWEYFIDSTESNTEYKGALQEIQESFDDVVEYDYQRDTFFMFLLDSQLWRTPPFNFIIMALGSIVTIGIFTAILRLFRR